MKLEEREGTGTHKATDGQPYFTLTHCGIKAEGDAVLYYIAASSPATAEAVLLDMYQREFDRLCEQQPPNTAIEWRFRPLASYEEVLHNPGTAFETKLYLGRIRARLAFIRVV